MKILLHSGAGNLDRPERWKFVTKLFYDLSQALTSLGHDTKMLIHPKALIPKRSNNMIISSTINNDKICDFYPDAIYTWNGNSEGDKMLRGIYPDSFFVYGELGFLNHYGKTCYFDSNGINTTMSNITSSLETSNPKTLDERLFQILKPHFKPRLYDNPYVFVVLQDETDTQIRQYSPFKTMYDFVSYVLKLLKYDNRRILIKKHPMYDCDIPSDAKIKIVKDDVHHYIPYADIVIGINSTVLIETLFYHNKIFPVGLGIASRKFNNDIERKQYAINLFEKQLNWGDLSNPDKIMKQEFYKQMMDSIHSSKCKQTKL